MQRLNGCMVLYMSCIDGARSAAAAPATGCAAPPAREKRRSMTGLFDGLVVRLTQAEEELFGLGAGAGFGPDTDPVLSDDQAAVRACLSRMLQLVDGVAA